MKQRAALFYSEILVCLSITPNHAMAALLWSEVTFGYSNCRLDDLGDGFSEASVDIGFNSAIYMHGAGDFISRSIALYSYSISGQPQSVKAQSILLDGDRSYNELSLLGAIYYYSKSFQYYSWGNPHKSYYRTVIRLSNAYLTAGTGIAISAGNLGEIDFVADLSGAVYINDKSNGVCKLISDPSIPPPQNDINITITAPDWHLGHINPGQQTIPLSGSAEQLCLTYTGGSVAEKLFIINATNQHGVKNNLYRMRNLHTPSQEIPYMLILNGTVGGSVVLPNAYNSTITLNSGGSTCFIPTFITVASDNLEPGIYTDVLTFNIVTKT